MRFELELDPEAATRLKGLPLAASAGGRAQKRRVIWHDSPDRTLAAAGLSLAEERGAWRLERLCPGMEDWPPALPAPLIAEDGDPARLGHHLPSTLAPAAACEALVSDHVLQTEQGLVELRRLRGVLRTVTAERPVARLVLSGSEAAILCGAKLLGGTVAARVPRASLAAEAFAAARNALPDPRRLGAPTLPTHGSVPDAFAHVLGHLTDVILHHAVGAADPAGGPESIHQMRVAVRRLRSAMTVFRPVIASGALEATVANLRTLARGLGPAREWDVFVTETAPAVVATLPGDARLERLLAAAQRRRAEARASLSTYLVTDDFRRLGIELAWLAGTRGWEARPEPGAPETAAPEALSDDLPHFARKALQRRFRRLRAAGKDIEALDIPSLHDLRLRAKRMRYAAEIMTPLFPAKPTRRFIQRLSQLQARLGVLNDGAVATSLMNELGGPSGRYGYAVGLVLGFSAGETSQSRSQIFQAWKKFLHQPSFWS